MGDWKYWTSTWTEVWDRAGSPSSFLMISLAECWNGVGHHSVFDLCLWPLGGRGQDCTFDENQLQTNVRVCQLNQEWKNDLTSAIQSKKSSIVLLFNTQIKRLKSNGSHKIMSSFTHLHVVLSLNIIHSSLLFHCMEKEQKCLHKRNSEWFKIT